MTYKASQLMSQFAEIKEQIRRKKALLQLQNCSHCGGPIDFTFEIRRDEQTVVESGVCKHCQEKLSPRKFSIC